MTKGHTQVEQGLADFSDSVPSARSWFFPLAGWGLAAGRIRVWNGTGAVLNSRRCRHWGSRTRGTPQPPPQLLTHRHLLRDSSCLTCEKDKDLERELGVIYYAENMDLICLTENL